MIQLEIFTGQNCMGIPNKASALLVLHRLRRHSTCQLPRITSPFPKQLAISPVLVPVGTGRLYPRTCGLTAGQSQRMARCRKEAAKKK